MRGKPIAGADYNPSPMSRGEGAGSGSATRGTSTSSRLVRRPPTSTGHLPGPVQKIAGGAKTLASKGCWSTATTDSRPLDARPHHPPGNLVVPALGRRSTALPASFVAAKSISTLAYLYERRICVNMVAGGFKNDLVALDDDTPHDERYDRLVEYVLPHPGTHGRIRLGHVPGGLLPGEEPQADPPGSAQLRPEFFISGSSTAGLAAARTVGATAVKYPGPAEEESDISAESIRCGIRVGSSLERMLTTRGALQ